MKRIIGVFITIALLLTIVGVVSAKVNRVAEYWEITAPNAIIFGCGGGTYNHTLDIVTNDFSCGTFEGEGTYDSNSSYTWDITGSIDGDDITFTLIYTGINSGYTLNGSGTIAVDGSISGTVNGNCQTFLMEKGTAVRFGFQGNHGQWVRTSNDKQETAQSRIGMPAQSKGHIK